MKIRTIDQSDILIEDVILLGKRNANKLGLFPRDAFIDHAKKKWIIVAEIDGNLAGYILFRHTASKGAIFITHLCIAEEYRRSGVADKLMSDLKKHYCRQTRGIGLSCREDYFEASNFWKKSGFIVKKKIRSRSRKENYLQKWWFDFGNPDLFTSTYTSTSKKAVLDLNVIINMLENDTNQNEEIKAFESSMDWADENIIYMITQETYSEIMRDSDNERAERTRNFISNYKVINQDPHKIAEVSNELSLIIKGDSENDISDRKQLAESIVHKADYFITADNNILSNVDEIWNKYELDIQRPLDFVLNLDSNLYQDISLPHIYEVTFLEHVNPQSKEIENIVDDFLKPELGERKNSFRESIIKNCSDFTNARVQIIRNRQKENGALLIASLKDPIAFEVIHVRVNTTKVEGTFFNQLISNSILLAIKNQRNLIKVKEVFLSPDQILILKSYGFSKVEDSWIKISLKGVLDWTDITNNPLVKLYNSFPNIEEEANSLMYNIERKLFPVKIKDLQLPTYIIPIKPYWASQLFDYLGASQSLFGAKSSLLWNRENIYYRSEKPVSEIAPGRILWYASSDENNPRGQSIVACSYIDSVFVDTAKQLYSRFKSYGVYQWSEILSLAQSDPHKKIKAIRFSDTEVFERPVKFKSVQKILQNNGQASNTFASPVQVNNDIFNEIYIQGTK